jgi:selenocysteine-specific elongation factor
MIDARLQTVTGARALRHGARVRFHQGTSEILGRVAVAAVLPRAGTPAGPEISPAAEVPGGADAYVRLRLEAPAVLSRGDRFILRAYSPAVTVAGGVVLDPFPARGAIRTPGARARFERLDPGRAPGVEADDRAVAAMIAERGPLGLPITALVSRAGLSPDAVDAAIERQLRSGAAVRAADRLVASEVVAALTRQALAIIADHHRAEPLSSGVPREEVRERVFGRAGDAVFDLVTGSLQRAGSITGRDRLALASHKVALSGEEEAASRTIEEAFRSAGLKPPDAQAVAAASGLVPDVVDRVVKLLVRQRVLVRLDTILIHEQALARLRTDMAALKAGAGGGQARIDVATFKDRYGVSRKYAIPLLEYLDRERVTRRVGDARVLI